MWDVDGIWAKLCRLSRAVLDRLGGVRPAAVAVTAWGADGALVDRGGGLVYPAISWQCQRTREVVPEVLELVSPSEVFRITGYQVMHFNTLFKLYWIRKHAPDALERAHTWLMMPGLIAHRLCGEFHIDPTSASTMMAMDLGRRDWSPQMLSIVGLDPGFFPEWAEPGEVVGYVTEGAARSTGIPAGTPVVAAGHDPQFAILASGVRGSEAVLSSGTWEILALRSDRYDPNDRALELGVIIEADAVRGLWNPQMLMIASAVLEWLRRLAFPELGPSEYAAMVEEARRVEPGSGGLVFVPSFAPDSGPLSRFGVGGAVVGLGLATSRGQLYRAALEGLSMQLRLALESLEEAFGLKVSAVWAVGEGSRDELWNEIRASVLGLPVHALRFGEATAVGAAVAALKGAGVYGSFEEGLRAARLGSRTFAPARAEAYGRLYRRFLAVVRALSQAAVSQG